MRRPPPFAWLLSCTWLCAANSCGNVADDPNVDYGDSQPLGRWPSTAVQARFETEGATATTPKGARDPDDEDATTATAGRPAIATSSGSTAANMVTPAQGAQGSKAGAAGAAAPSGSPNPAQSMTGSAGAAADGGGQTKPAEAPPAESGKVTSLQFNVMTESLNGRYKPKNIGAIWIADESGKLVKSLEVWARVRLRYLTKYASSRGGARPDVTATATLTSHKAHMASWDLKDTTGAAVAPGKYTLNAEITDADATGKNVSVPFDLSAGPMTVKPADSTGFTAMELVLK